MSKMEFELQKKVEKSEIKKEIDYQKRVDATKNINTITGQPLHFYHKFVVFEPN